MVDIDDARLQDGMNRAEEVVMSRIKIGRATPMDLANMLAAISTSTSPKIFADCDVVIEAVTENESLKKEVYKGLAQVIRDRRHPGDATPRRSRSPGWPSPLRTPSSLSACTSSARSIGWSSSRSSAAPRPAT